VTHDRGRGRTTVYPRPASIRLALYCMVPRAVLPALVLEWWRHRQDGPV